jgi:hypothetical protein
MPEGKERGGERDRERERQREKELMTVPKENKFSERLVRLLHLILSGNGSRTTCGGDIRNIRTKKDGVLPIVNSD